MAKEIDLIVEPRDISGTSNARRMRHAGMVPAVIYGAAKETLHLAIDHNQLLRKLANESFLNSILTIKIGNQEESVLIKDIQIHPAKKQVMHLDLQRVKSDVVIRVSIPLQFINEEQSEGVKLEGGTVTALMNEVEVYMKKRKPVVLISGSIFSSAIFIGSVLLFQSNEYLGTLGMISSGIVMAISALLRKY